MNRIYGRPDDALVVKAPAIAPAAHEIIRSMSLDEKLELLQRLRAGADLPALLAGRAESDGGQPPALSEHLRGSRPVAGRALTPGP